MKPVIIAVAKQINWMASNDKFIINIEINVILTRFSRLIGFFFLESNDEHEKRTLQSL